MALNPIHAGEGLLVLSVITDISVRKDAEKHLAQMEGRYRGLLEAAPDAMVVVNQSGEIVLLNLQAEKQFGYRRDELVGQKVKNIIPEGFAERLIADDLRSAEDALAQQIGTGIELTGRRKDGSEFPIEIMLSPLESAEGILVTAAIRDISVRKRMERLKDEFVSTVSHELRTPLTSIAGSLGLLVGNAAGKLPEARHAAARDRARNSQRLVRLINDILDIEKIESGQVVFNLSGSTFDRWSSRRSRPIADSPRATACAFGSTRRRRPAVRADPDRLVQVVTNLLSNAIKFSPAGRRGDRGDRERKASTVRISVRDHGPAFRPISSRASSRNSRRPTPRTPRQKGGTGLGLSIVKQIVERLGGEVGFDDAPGGGTVFHVELPCWDHIASREIDLDGDPDAARILLCEDTRYRDGLERAAAANRMPSTLPARQGDALTRAAATPYAVMLVDLELPGRRWHRTSFSACGRERKPATR